LLCFATFWFNLVNYFFNARFIIVKSLLSDYFPHLENKFEMTTNEILGQDLDNKRCYNFKTGHSRNGLDFLNVSREQEKSIKNPIPTCETKDCLLASAKLTATLLVSN